MTQGSITRQLILFSIPLLIGNFFQQLYNTVDSIIVGQFVGKQALAAVGTSLPLINLLIGFFMGVAAGASIIISQYYGAKRWEDLRKAVHTFCWFTLVVGIIMTIIGVAGSSFFLSIIGVPSDIFQDANDYLKIYFAGIGVTMIYNSGAGILRAVGDSRRPLYFLIVSSLTNVVLDLVFVVNFNMGVKGVAWATVLATIISSVLVIWTLVKDKGEYRVSLKEIRLHKDVLREIIRIGIPSGLQQIIVSISNTMVQAYVNSFSSAAIAGFGTGRKFDNFLVLPIQSFGLAITTFVGQNAGAKQLERARKGVRVCLFISILIIILLGIPVYFNAEFCISLFTSDAEVIRIGAQFMRTVCPFYFAMCFNAIYTGAIRGVGVTIGPTIIQVFCFCFVRQAMLALLMPVVKDINLVFYGYALTWCLSALMMAIYYYRGKYLYRDVHAV